MKKLLLFVFAIPAFGQVQIKLQSADLAGYSRFGAYGLRKRRRHARPECEVECDRRLYFGKPRHDSRSSSRDRACDGRHMQIPDSAPDQ